jgi:hypothetical protein
MMPGSYGSPKGLPSNHEAWIEVRKEKYDQVSLEYIGKKAQRKMNRNIT